MGADRRARCLAPSVTNLLQSRPSYTLDAVPEPMATPFFGASVRVEPMQRGVSQLSQPQRGSAAAAGIMLVLAIVICTAIGLGLGLLVQAPAPLAIAGGFIGLVLGFALVYTRFKDI